MCDLIFVSRESHLDAAAEKAQYDLHENNPDDPAYRKFLAQLADPLIEQLALIDQMAPIERVAHGARGLDFGCGPGPTLNVMLEEAGFNVALYDPFFAPDNGQLSHSYDFITATEVAEHLRDPAGEFAQLWRMLRPGGVLALMTWMTDEIDDLAGWHYMRDPTHICFYSQRSFVWLAEHLGAEVNFHGNKVILLSKVS